VSFKLRMLTSARPWVWALAERVTPRVCGLVTGGALRARCIVMVDMIDLADVEGMLLAAYGAPDTRHCDDAGGEVGRCRLTPVESCVESAWFQLLKLYDNCLQLSLTVSTHAATARSWRRGSPPHPPRPPPPLSDWYIMSNQ